MCRSDQQLSILPFLCLSPLSRDVRNTFDVVLFSFATFPLFGTIVAPAGESLYVCAGSLSSSSSGPSAWQGC